MLTSSERFLTAIHEAGHCLCFAAFPAARFQAHVSRTDALRPGLVQYRAAPWIRGTALAQWEAQFALAGAAAEEVMLGWGSASPTDERLYLRACARLRAPVPRADTERLLTGLIAANRTEVLRLADHLCAGPLDHRTARPLLRSVRGVSVLASPGSWWR